MSMDSKRERTMTEKGRSFNLDIKHRALLKCQRELDGVTTLLNQLTDDENTDKNKVISVHADWVNCYEQFYEANQQVMNFLHETELETHEELFRKVDGEFKAVKANTEQWILRHSVQDQDTRSQFSGRSTASSQISIARMKEEQKKAELMARASALEKRRKLEEEKLALKLKEEELQIITELEVTDARSKILNELERSMMEDKMIVDSTTNCVVGSATNCVAGSATNGAKKEPVQSEPSPEKHYTLNPEVKEWFPQASSQGIPSNDKEHELQIVSRELNKPKAEIKRFSGNSIDYHQFLRQFKSRVCNNTSCYEERLNFLLQFTEGEAYRIVSGYSHLDSEAGYKAALEEFEERYGDQDVIAQAYVKRALEWPSIRPDNPQDLDRFGIFLRECQLAVESLESSRVLEYSENIRQLLLKLPYYLHDKWRNNVYEIKGRKEIVKFKHFVDFVRKEAKKATDPVYGREVLSSKAPARQANDKRPVNVNGRTRKSFVTTVEESNKVSRGDKNKTDETANNEKCMICEGSHLLDSCSGMSKWTLKDRYSFLKSKGLCFGCLRAGHTKRSCQSKIKCKVCDRYHPSILHVDPHPKVTNATARTIASATHSHKGAGDDVQALPIVAVRVKHESSDKYVETYAFLDSGSTATFCSDRLADRLNVQGRKAQINLLTMGNERTQNTRVIKGLEASSLNGDDTVCLGTVFTQPSLPVSKKDIIAPEVIQQWPHLKNLPLSRIESDVDLLIGVNVPRAMEPWEVIPSLNEGPFAVKTALGWVVNGPLSLPSKDRNTTDSYTHNCFRIDCVQIDSVPSLDQQIRNQFDYDFCERTIDDKLEYSVEDKKFIEMVNKSIVLDNGHYTIDLPFRSGSLSMINNRSQAEQRLRLLAKRMKQDPSFGEQYRKFMCNVIEKGYAEAVPPETLQRTDGQVWYLPHHGVFHPKKKKIRVVFDCAAKFQGMSLNDELLQGPNLTNTLIGTLTRFRQDEVVFMGDIESMSYQVHVPEKDRDFQRFLWFEDGNPENKAIEYRMTVHLFGSKSSPSCANFALRQCALQCQGHFNEEVINTVLKNFYVDDCLKSTRTVDRAKSLVQELKTLLNHGGFSISKWISNSKEVMNSIPATERAKGAISLDFDQDSLPIERALGMDWCAETDKFTFTLNLKDNKVTRRGILSMVSSVFDPLGFLAPMLLKAKLLLQELCKMNLGWDTPIPEPYANRWIQLLCDIQRITEFKVDRCFKTPGFDEVKATELHNFADASESGYGVVSYLRTVNIKNEVHCSFVMGKSRVSPLKKVTVPRLELTAATVAVRTDKMLKSELEISVDRSFFWTDSMSVLRYIRNTTSRFHTFVANRLNVIHEASSADDWHYINTKMNPADLASRGLIVDVTLWSERWIKAPKFLWEMEANQIENPPEEAFEMVENDPEVKRVKLNCAAINSVEHETDSEGIHKLILKHSIWLSLKRSVAWILKIRKELLRRAHCRKTNENANAKFDDKRQIMVEDLVEAEKAILMVIQKDAFPEEICSLRQEQPKLKRGSRIKQSSTCWRSPARISFTN